MNRILRILLLLLLVGCFYVTGQEVYAQQTAEPPVSEQTVEDDDDDDDEEESDTVISSVSIAAPTMPKAGSGVYIYTAAPREGVYVSGYWTLNGLPVLKFQAGKTYVLTLTVTALKGYSFAENVSLLVGGTPSDFTGGDKLISLKLSYVIPGTQEPEETTEPQETTEPEETTEPQETTEPEETTEPDVPETTEKPEITYTHVPETRPSCEENGVKEHYVGSDGKFYLDQNGKMEETAKETLILPALGHDWTGPTYVWGEDGKSCTAYRGCRRDQAHFGIAYGIVTCSESEKPTCDKPGSLSCRAVFTEPWAAPCTKKLDNLPALGHDWGETVYRWSQDGKSCTAERVCRRDSSHKEQEQAQVVWQTLKEPTLDQKGLTQYTAQFTGEFAQTQKKVLADQEILEEVRLPYVEKDGSLPGRNLRSENGAPGLYASISMDSFRVLCDDRKGSREGVTFSCGPVSVRYSETAVDSILNQTKNADLISVSIQQKDFNEKELSNRQLHAVKKLKKARLYEVELNAVGNKKCWEIDNFSGGNAYITVPYERTEGFRIAACRIEENGTLTKVPCHYDNEAGTITFETDSHSHYAVMPARQDLILVWTVGAGLFALLILVMILNRKGILGGEILRFN